MPESMTHQVEPIEPGARIAGVVARRWLVSGCDESGPGARIRRLTHVRAVDAGTLNRHPPRQRAVAASPQPRPTASAMGERQTSRVPTKQMR